MKSHPDICILLAIHNGARFLEEQLDSLLAQSHPHWRLLAYDDHSSDNSLEILRAHPVFSRCTLIPSARQRLGARGAFSRLLDAAAQESCSWFALCDQDDYWVQDKLQQLLTAASSLPASEPVLIHSDMRVCDARLRTLAPSYMAYTNNRHEAKERALKTLLNKNFVSGCTTLFNRTLLHRATPVPESAYMHDWWLALCAAATGQVLYLDAPLVLYRQHEHNSVGAQTDWQLLRLRIASGLTPVRKQFFATCLQADSMAQHLADSDAAFRVSPAWQLLTNYAELPRLSRWQRLRRYAAGCCLHRHLGFRLLFMMQLLISPIKNSQQDA